MERLPDSRKSLVTAWPVTGVGPFSGMDAPVFGEVTGFAKSLLTARPITGVGLFFAGFIFSAHF